VEGALCICSHCITTRTTKQNFSALLEKHKLVTTRSHTVRNKNLLLALSEKSSVPRISTTNRSHCYKGWKQGLEHGLTEGSVYD